MDINDDRVVNRFVYTNPIIAKAYNLDFDGDNMGYNNVQSEQGKNEFHKLFLANHVKLYFDPDTYIPNFTHEGVYALWGLTTAAQKSKTEETYKQYEYDTFTEIPISYENIDKDLDKWVFVKSAEKKMHLIYALMHKAIYKTGLTEGKVQKLIFDVDKSYSKSSSKEILDGILEIAENTIDFQNKLWKLEQFLSECSSISKHCIPTFDLDDFVVLPEGAKKLKKQFVSEPVIGFHQNMYLFNKIVLPYLETKKDGENILNRVYKSGSKLKAVQIMKSCGSSGIATDVYGKATENNVSTSLLEGLSPYEMFQLSNGARLSLAARESLIPKAGEFQRIIMNSIGFLMLDHNVDDCGTTKGFQIEVLDKKHLRSLDGRYMVTGKKISKNDTHLIGKTVEIFSPMTCKHKEFKICKKCWGDHLPPHDKKGFSYLGALGGSAFSEQLAQSGLRLHHTGGTWEIGTINQDLYDIIENSEMKTIEVEDRHVVLVKTDKDRAETLKNILYDYYDESELDFYEIEDGYVVDPKIRLSNQDTSKILREFANLAYRRRTLDANTVDAELIPQSEMYKRIIEIIFDGAYLLSVYIETILSALYYDEDMNSARYSDKPAAIQIPLKSVINELDPKLNIFYRLNSNNIKNIYDRKGEIDLDHMMFRLTDCYK